MITELTAIDSLALFAILGMAAATYVTRAAGFWLMGYVEITPRIERFLRHMAGGVLVAIVTAAAMNGSPAMWIGLATAFGAMLLLRKPMTAILIGVAIAALLRHFAFG